MERRQGAARRRSLRSVTPTETYPETPQSILPGTPGWSPSTPCCARSTACA
jgi:hypothetical protein